MNLIPSDRLHVWFFCLDDPGAAKTMSLSGDHILSPDSFLEASSLPVEEDNCAGGSEVSIHAKRVTPCRWQVQLNDDPSHCRNAHRCLRWARPPWSKIRTCMTVHISSSSQYLEFECWVITCSIVPCSTKGSSNIRCFEPHAHKSHAGTSPGRR